MVCCYPLEPTNTVKGARIMERVKQEEPEAFDEEKYARLRRYSYVFMYVSSQIEIVCESHKQTKTQTLSGTHAATSDRPNRQPPCDHKPAQQASITHNPAVSHRTRSTGLECAEEKDQRTRKGQEPYQDFCIFGKTGNAREEIPVSRAGSSHRSSIR